MAVIWTRSIAALAFAAAGLAASSAAAQSIAAEADVTAGSTTQNVDVGALQVRLFGELPAGWRFYVESTAALSSGPPSDAFSAAYPYSGGVRPMEAYVEKTAQKGRTIAGLRAGRYRTPFGLYQRSDHAYGGFLRAPLVRYGDYFALSSTALEAGVSALGGIGRVQAEASIGTPSDEGLADRRPGMDRAARVQVYAGQLILGASYLHTQPSQPARFARGRTEFTGLDARWMHRGIQVRGELLTGRPFDGVYTHGWYVDGLVHVRAMGPVTAAIRTERLRYLAGVRSIATRRTTAGARIRVPGGVAIHVNGVAQPEGRRSSRLFALDIGVTYSVRVRR